MIDEEIRRRVAVALQEALPGPNTYGVLVLLLPNEEDDGAHVSTFTTMGKADTIELLAQAARSVFDPATKQELGPGADDGPLRDDWDPKVVELASVICKRHLEEMARFSRDAEQLETL